MSIRVAFLFCLLPLVALGNIGCGHPVTFVVKDEQQRPIEGANILVVYQRGWVPGEGFGRDLYASQEKTTDKSGKANFRVSPYGNPRFDYEVEVPKGRYYPNVRSEDVPLSKEGMTQISVILRAKRTPLKVCYQHREAPWLPKADEKVIGHNANPPLGFDAVIGDWLAPYGKGRIADFLFRSYYEESGTPYVRNSFGVLELGKDFRYAAAFSLTFANEGDGIVEAIRYWPKSTLPIEREAPVEGYQKEFRMEWHRPELPTDFKQDKSRQYFFRIRTQRDAKGKIIYALYGKLEDDFLFGSLRFDQIQQFSYTLNLEPLSQNLENNGEYQKNNNVNTLPLRTHINADYIRRFPSVLLNQDDYLRSLPTLAEEERKKTSAQAEP